MTWALELDAADAAACGALRHEPGIDACIVAGRLWLRGQALDDALAARLRLLPALGRFHVTDDGRLVAEGARVPTGRLPEGRWFALHCWLPLEAPPVRRAGSSPPIGRMRLDLVRGGAAREANLLEIPFAVWEAHATRAPAIRLARLAFAVDDWGRALVRGTPLPALPGRRLVEEAGVAVEAGWEWRPEVSPATLRGLAGAGGDELLLVDRAPDAAGVRFTILPGDAFVRATRSAVRLSALALTEERR